jgi:O-antigen/teichoic acid export membrane protein
VKVKSGTEELRPAQRASVMKAGVLTTLSRVFSQAAQLAIFLLAARIMGPAQFGVFALVSAIAIIALRFSEAGWAEFVMNWQGAAEVPGQVLLIAILSGLAVAGLGAATSLAVPALTGNEDAARLGLLFSLWILLTTVAAVQNGLMVHQDKLSASALVMILGEAAGFAVSLWSLRQGHGIFALAYGRLAQQTVQVTVAAGVTRVRPRLGMERATLLQLMQFSGHILSSRMISCLRVYAATFVIGGFLGPASVGYFRLAQRLVGAFAEVLGETGRMLAWTVFRNARRLNGGTIRGFQEEARIFFPALLVLAVPVFLWIAVEADALVLGLLGPDWLPAVPVVVLLALSQCLFLPTYATEPLLSMAGQVRQMPRVSLTNALVAIALALVTAPFGMIAVAVGQGLAALVALATSIWLQQRHAGLCWRTILQASLPAVPPLSVATLLLVILKADPLLAQAPPLPRIALSTLVVLLVYVAGLALCYPAASRRIAGSLVRRVRAAS